MAFALSLEADLETRALVESRSWKELGMRTVGSQRGESKVGCIFWSLIALLFVIVGKEVVTIKMGAMKLEDHMIELAMTQGKREQDFFQREIYNKARFLDLAVDRKQIRVKKFPERVVMDVEFIAPVEVLSFTYEWNIKIHVDRDVFWF